MFTNPAKRRAKLVLIAVAACLPAAVAAQSATDHSAHHPGVPPAADAAPKSAAAKADPAPPMDKPPGSMAAMMDEMMGGEMEQGKQTSAYSALLAVPDLDPSERQKLVEDAQARLHRGLGLASRATSDAHGPDAPDGSKLASDLREAAALIESGSAAAAVLDGRQDGSQIANNWFRAELGLAPVEDHASMTGMLWGLSPGHWLFMAATLLALAALLLLQLLRLRRVRALVTAERSQASSAGTPALAPTGLAPGVASAASAVPVGDPVTTSPPPLPSALPAAASGAQTKRWAGDLRIAQIFTETPTIKTFRMIPPGADRLPFDFLPGQFLQVEVASGDGNKAKRSYTIASSPTQRAYVELTVKREAQGAVSRHLHDNVQAGDLVRIAGPFGHFTFTGTDAESIVLIAGGVGITPMMSILRFLTDTAWPGDIFFVYAARATEEFVFRAEIELLERRHPNLHVFASMQRTPGTVWHGAEGHITRELLEAAVPEIAKRRIHLCGPPPMMAAMRNILTEIGVPQAQIFSEAFGPASLPIDEPVQEEAGNDAAAATASPRARKAQRNELAATTVTFSVAGVSAPLDADETVLEAAEGAGVEIPYSCRVGECGVCVTRLLEGEVTMDVETGLDPADKAQGYVLACQARCTRGPLVVEA